jgi:hypothetical protein
MMAGGGIFAEWQPRYAEAGIPTFPVRNKKPAVKGYLKTGPILSSKLADKFGGAEAFGFSCKRAGVTIVDVDTPDENVLADALAQYGDTSVIVRSGSGNFQAWYRNGGEPRKIRPDKGTPIDILGGGYVVAPPSVGSKGAYGFVSGSLDDLPSLPRLRGLAEPVNDLAAPEAVHAISAEVGQRNASLFAAAGRAARNAVDYEALLSHVGQVNAAFPQPLPHSEVISVSLSAWDMQGRGVNRFGGEMLVGVRVSQFDRISADPFALSLYMTLRRRWRDGESFSVANDMHKSIGFPLRKFVDARRFLENNGLLIMTRKPIKGVGPAVYQFG